MRRRTKAFSTEAMELNIKCQGFAYEEMPTVNRLSVLSNDNDGTGPRSTIEDAMDTFGTVFNNLGILKGKARVNA